MKRLFSVHKGRTNRSTFFMGLFFWGILLGAFLLFLEDFKSKGVFGNVGLDILLILFVLALEIYFIYLGIALWIRRLHDINRSGWWFLIICIPIINLFSFAYLIYKAGNNSKNKYGDKPPSVLV